MADFDMPAAQKRIRTRIEMERRAAGLSQKGLALAAGVDQGFLSRIENAKSFRPGFDTLDRLAAALRIHGRQVDARDLQPRRQPLLVKGLLGQSRQSSKKRAGAA